MRRAASLGARHDPEASFQSSSWRARDRFRGRRRRAELSGDRGPMRKSSRSGDRSFMGRATTGPSTAPPSADVLPTRSTSSSVRDDRPARDDAEPESLAYVELYRTNTATILKTRLSQGCEIW
jgi:hypothetical protein